MFVRGYGMVKQAVAYDSTGAVWELGTALSGFRALESVASDYDTVPVTLRRPDGEWAIGFGVFLPTVVAIGLVQTESSASWDPDPADETAAVMIVGPHPMLFDSQPPMIVGSTYQAVPTATETAIDLGDVLESDPFSFWNTGSTQFDWVLPLCMIEGQLVLDWGASTNGTYRTARIHFDGSDTDPPVVQTWPASVGGTQTVMTVLPHIAALTTDRIRVTVQHDAGVDVDVAATLHLRLSLGLPLAWQAFFG